MSFSTPSGCAAGGTPGRRGRSGAPHGRGHRPPRSSGRPGHGRDGPRWRRGGPAGSGFAGSWRRVSRLAEWEVVVFSLDSGETARRGRYHVPVRLRLYSVTVWPDVFLMPDIPGREQQGENDTSR